jgi:acylpyruvate hydrolase
VAREANPLTGEVELGPLVDPGAKVLCVGHNYKRHILEMGHELPSHPNVFSKFPEAIIGPYDDIVLDAQALDWDWEAELALVVGKPARCVPPEQAGEYIAGYTIANDVSARDWQRRSSQWLLGKTFERTTPVGPWLVTPDELDDPSAGLAITCSVDGAQKQNTTTADLLFDAAFLVSYLSSVVTLRPGDLVLTGTPGGVGAARQPAERLHPGQKVVTEIAGLGRLENLCIASGSISPSS